MINNVTENTITLLDYMPHIIAIVSIVATIVLACIQHQTSIKLYQKNSNFDAKKEAIQEALDFLDICISFREIDGNYQPLNIPMSDEELTALGRRAHNKLCVTCDSKEILEAFMAIVNPDKVPYPIYEYYDNFRNLCRKELGFPEIDLPKDKIYITVISTRKLKKTQPSS